MRFAADRPVRGKRGESMRHGSHLNPPNRFEKLHTEVDLDQQPGGGDHRPDHLGRDVEYLDDESLSIVTENRSPDLPFRYSLNPYRGCVHACRYCCYLPRTTIHHSSTVIAKTGFTKSTAVH